MQRFDATPPRFVPTLTEVVKSPELATAIAPQAAPQASAQSLDEQAWTARIMQDLDVTLEAKLRQVVAKVVSEQLSGMVPVLRAELEFCVKDAVRQALARQIR